MKIMTRKMKIATKKITIMTNNKRTMDQEYDNHH
jgi:hypothetical protein